MDIISQGISIEGIKDSFTVGDLLNIEKEMQNEYTKRY